ncbi:MAG: rubrerythrin family protein [Promethearchaeota archaeon]
MSKSEQNLKEAFAGESQANRKYLAFSKKADEEGFNQVAKLFRAAAAAETIHAHNHLREFGGIKSTKENLQAAIKGENYEFTEMYPEFLKIAQSEGNKSAERSFYLANEVEKVHHKLYKAALKALDAEKDLEIKDIYICQICGYTHQEKPPEKCPVCGAAKKMFVKIE